MAKRKKAGELRETEVECGYCGAIIQEDALSCPSCGKMFSAARAMVAFAIVVIVVLASMSFFVYNYYTSGQQSYNGDLDPIDPDNGNGGTPVTNGKTIVFELKELDAPNTCANFKAYVNDNFYNGLIFHRVIDGFMIQGSGFYPGITEKQPTYPPINLEISPNLRHVDGAVAMARTNDPNSATCQFYICDGPQDFLNDNYAVFGQVTSGMDHVRAISAVQTGTVGGHSDVPLNDVKIISTSLSTSGGKTYVTLVVDY
jgi:peptidyl-prolyl cis-trans isomerase B (cyclophilin B)